MKLGDLKSGDLDRKVTYTPFKGCDPSLIEEGVITSWNSKFVFVRYGSDVNSKSTYPYDIEFVGSEIAWKEQNRIERIKHKLDKI